MKRQSKSTGTTSSVDPKIKSTSSSQRLVAPLAWWFTASVLFFVVSVLLEQFCNQY
ncbi:hypothetical protein RchiOBHm_Chr4g0402671 [Rosa chinensis]|uniref:Uncharacterized protein n=1 Tax=Rosa chinensis TaxID=74649 RepID=A0A2P6QTC8_ROSCH|nr:hypothetical protein RchiOBHm_Chr4g0402671 [Rosa chinensis]